MRLDPDLIREILLTIDADHGPYRGTTGNLAVGRGIGEIHLHLVHMAESGMLSGHCSSEDGLTVLWLTDRGRQFAGYVRDEAGWRRARRWCADGAPGSFELIAGIMSSWSEREAATR